MSVAAPLGRDEPNETQLDVPAPAAVGAQEVHLTRIRFHDGIETIRAA
jgi:hypothetical protein